MVRRGRRKAMHAQGGDGGRSAVPKAKEPTPHVTVKQRWWRLQNDSKQPHVACRSAVLTLCTLQWSSTKDMVHSPQKWGGGVGGHATNTLKPKPSCLVQILAVPQARFRVSHPRREQQRMYRTHTQPCQCWGVSAPDFERIHQRMHSFS